MNEQIIEKEAKFIWDVTNMMQINLMNNLKKQVEALEKIDNSDKFMAKNWLTETKEEYEMMMTIKAKMSKIINGE